MKRNPHPARRSRIAALGISSTAFVSIVTSLAWNTHQAEAALNVPSPNVLPAGHPTPAQGATTPVPAPATLSATIAPSAPGAPAKPTKTAAPTVAPATPAAPTAATVAPDAPTPTVVYTCMSPGGKTENPTAAGKCTNARYGYVLTKI